MVGRRIHSTEWNGEGMSEDTQPSKGFKFAHGAALTLLFLLMLQPSIDNIRSFVSGTWQMGDGSLEVTFANAIGHVIAMALGWVAWGLYFKRRKIGAYLTVVAHGLGFVAAFVGMPDLLFAMMPPAMIGVFFAVMIVIALGPIFAFKDQYR